MPQPAPHGPKAQPDLILRGPHAQVQQPQQAAAVQAPQSSLPPSWTAEMDPGSGHVYYHNAETGETQWEVPQWGAPPPVSAHAPPTPQQSAWQSVVDPSSGQTYYHNVQTGETSWERR
jgi:hypothetical protein